MQALADTTTITLPDEPAAETITAGDSASWASYYRHIEGYTPDPADCFALAPADSDTTATAAPLPQYYRKTFFEGDTLVATRPHLRDYGVAGDPVPYTVSSDSTIAVLLLGCFVVASIAFAGTRKFMLLQFKKFFFPPKSASTFQAQRTSAETHFLNILRIQTYLMIAIGAYFYATEKIADTYVLTSPYYLIAVYFGLTALYFTLRRGLHAAAGLVFFGSRATREWLEGLTLVQAVEGVALLPMVLLLIYFEVGVDKAMTYFVCTLAAVKLLTLYKCWTAFFKQNNRILQMFLYFCTLEIIPLLAFGASIVETAKYLKINY